VWVNGQFAGATGYRYPPRYYKTPPLPEGECEIVVRQTIFGAWGKFTEGKTRGLRFENGFVPITGDWERRRAAYFPMQQQFEDKEHYTNAHYNAMIAPLSGTAINGVLWYQGESDARTPDGYFERFRQLVSEWRELFGQVPFYTVALARFDETDWTAIREQQLKAAQLHGVYVFDAWEYGEANDLHPLDKKPIADGLFELSLKNNE